jgi:hypothetical protein
MFRVALRARSAQSILVGSKKKSNLDEKDYKAVRTSCNKKIAGGEEFSRAAGEGEKTAGGG